MNTVLAARMNQGKADSDATIQWLYTSNLGYQIVFTENGHGNYQVTIDDNIVGDFRSDHCTTNDASDFLNRYLQRDNTEALI